jgi:hypothetical protein
MIKEFDIDAPRLDKEARNRLRDQTRVVTCLLEQRIAPALEIGRAWKVLVEIVPQDSGKGVREALGVLAVEVEGDAGAFLEAAGAGEKGEIVLAWTIRGLEKVLGKAEADQVLRGVAGQVRQSGFTAEKRWRGPVRQPDGSLRADVIVRMRFDGADIVGRVLEAGDRVRSETLLFSSRPNEFIFSPHIGPLAWKDKDTVELTSRLTGETWSFPATTTSPA